MDQPTPVFTREGSFPLAVPDGPIAGTPTPIGTPTQGWISPPSPRSQLNLAERENKSWQPCPEKINHREQ